MMNMLDIIIIIASFLLLRVDRFITAGVTSAAHASVKQVVSSRESGGGKKSIFTATHLQFSAKTDLRTTCIRSYGRHISVSLQF